MFGEDSFAVYIYVYKYIYKFDAYVCMVFDIVSCLSASPNRRIAPTLDPRPAPHRINKEGRVKTCLFFRCGSKVWLITCYAVLIADLRVFSKSVSHSFGTTQRYVMYFHPMTTYTLNL